MNTCELVIFDCDGVLVDSENIANRVFREMLYEQGLELSLDDMFEKFVGYSSAQCASIAEALLGRALPEEFFPELRLRTANALAIEVTPIDGVRHVVNALEIPFCTASSGDQEKIRLTLGKTGLLAAFEGKIFSVDEVAQPKPAPDVFLHAAKQMGVDPQACVVVEDTPTGVVAGLKAGMRVYGFSLNTPQHRLQTAGAHATFSAMSDLLELVNQMR